MEYRVSWTIMDDRGLSWILAEYNGLWTMVDYHGLSWIMDYHGLAWLEGLSWIMGYHGLINMHPHGVAWITRYAPQGSDNT